MVDPAVASPPNEPPPDLLAFIQGGPPTTPGNDDAAAPSSSSLTSPSSLASPDPKQRLAEASAVLERASQAMAEAGRQLRLVASAEIAPRHRLAAAGEGSLAPTHAAQMWQPRLKRQGLRRGPPLVSGAQARAAAESADREAHGKREASRVDQLAMEQGRMEVARCQEAAENSRARAETARAAAPLLAERWPRGEARRCLCSEGAAPPPQWVAWHRMAPQAQLAPSHARAPPQRLVSSPPPPYLPKTAPSAPTARAAPPTHVCTWPLACPPSSGGEKTLALVTHTASGRSSARRPRCI